MAENFPVNTLRFRKDMMEIFSEHRGRQGIKDARGHDRCDGGRGAGGADRPPG